MERIKVPATKVLETLKAVATEQPEYVYEAPEHMTEGRSLTCFYVHADADSANVRPGCLVGKVFNALGVPLARLSQIEGTGAWSATGALLDMQGHPDEIRDARDALTTAQDAQDNGATWGDALERATRKPGE